MLDLPFMAAMCDAYPTFIEPLRHWRAVGVERADAFEDVAAHLPDPGTVDSTSNLMSVVAEVANFLRQGGLYQAADVTCPPEVGPVEA
jgi:hypothetical protein